MSLSLFDVISSTDTCQIYICIAYNTENNPFIAHLVKNYNGKASLNYLFLTETFLIKTKNK